MCKERQCNLWTGGTGATVSGRDCGIVSVGWPNAHVGKDRLFMKGRDGVCVERRDCVRL